MIVENFDQPVGAAVPIPDTVRGVFELIFVRDFINHIVVETNRYARTVMGEDRYRKWDKVEADDMYAYFGIMIMMGLVELPSLHDYWQRDPLFHCPAIAKRMARDRFLEIHKCLHFVNNGGLIPPGDPGYDRLCKVRGVLDMIEEKFASLYNPSRENAIDEAMVPYKGRSSLKQYMPKKPVRRGLKEWMRADSNDGYVSQFQVYVGKETSVKIGLGARVVKDLMQKIAEKHIFCDNFFTSVKLFQELHEVGVFATGNLRADTRGFPDDLKGCVKKGSNREGSVTFAGVGSTQIYQYVCGKTPKF